MQINLYEQLDEVAFEEKRKQLGGTSTFQNKAFVTAEGVHLFGVPSEAVATTIVLKGEQLVEGCKKKLKEEEKPAKAVAPVIVTTHYVSSHGKNPSGRGNWIFGVGSRDEKDWINYNDTYANAKKKAVEVAKKKGAKKVFVMEQWMPCEIIQATFSIQKEDKKFIAIVESADKLNHITLNEQAAVKKQARWLIEKAESIKVEEPKEVDVMKREDLKALLKKYRDLLGDEEVDDKLDELEPSVKQAVMDMLAAETEHTDAFNVKDAPKVKGLKTESAGIEQVTGDKTYRITGMRAGGPVRGQIMRGKNAAEALGNFFKLFGGSAQKIEVRQEDGSFVDITPEGSLRDKRSWEMIKEADEAMTPQKIQAEIEQAKAAGDKERMGQLKAQLDQMLSGEVEESVETPTLKVGDKVEYYYTLKSTGKKVKRQGKVEVNAGETIAIRFKDKYGTTRNVVKATDVIGPVDEMAIDRLKVNDKEIEWSDEGDNLHMIKDKDGIKIHAIGSRKDIAAKWAKIKGRVTEGAKDRSRPWDKESHTVEEDPTQIEEGLGNFARSLNYKRLARRSDNKSKAALDRSMSLGFANPDREAPEAEFMKQANIRDKRLQKAAELKHGGPIVVDQKLIDKIVSKIPDYFEDSGYVANAAREVAYDILPPNIAHTFWYDSELNEISPNALKVVDAYFQKYGSVNEDSQKFEIEYETKDGDEISSGKTSYRALDQNAAKQRFMDDNKGKQVTVKNVKLVTEVSTRTLDNYLDKAMDDVSHANMTRRNTADPKERASAARREKVRNKGITRAMDKWNKKVNEDSAAKIPFDDYGDWKQSAEDNALEIFATGAASGKYEARYEDEVMGEFDKNEGSGWISQSVWPDRGTMKEEIGVAKDFEWYDDWEAAAREAGAKVFKSHDPENADEGVRAYYLQGKKVVDVGYWADGTGQVTTYVEEDFHSDPQAAYATMSPVQLKRIINNAVGERGIDKEWLAPRTNDKDELIDHINELCNNHNLSPGNDGHLMDNSMQESRKANPMEAYISRLNNFKMLGQ